MLQRVSAMQSELDTLVESLRTGANRVSADLALLEGNMAELYSAAGARTEAPPEPEPDPIAVVTEVDVVEVELEPEPALEPEEDLSTPLQAVDSPDLNGAPAEAVTEPPVEDQLEPEPTVVTDEDDADVEGARLIALNMALNGQSREETDRYLAENFDLPDRKRLLDEVYASVEG
jgi:hypothetical protein